MIEAWATNARPGHCNAEPPGLAFHYLGTLARSKFFGRHYLGKLARSKISSPNIWGGTAQHTRGACEMQKNHANTSVHHPRVSNRGRRAGIFSPRPVRDLKPRSPLVKRLLVNVALPAMAVAAIAVTMWFPSPADFQRALPGGKPPVETATATTGVTDNVGPLIQAHATADPQLEQVIEHAGDCFVDLGSATTAKLERCAPTVIQALSRIAAIQGDRRSPPVLVGDNTTQLVEQLTLAATEACRAAWATAPELDSALSSPACLVAQAELAPGFNSR